MRLKDNQSISQYNSFKLAVDAPRHVIFTLAAAGNDEAEIVVNHT